MSEVLELSAAALTVGATVRTFHVGGVKWSTVRRAERGERRVSVELEAPDGYRWWRQYRYDETVRMKVEVH